MLQLRRPIHLSIHAAGHLTTALSWPSMPSQERCSTVNTFTRASDSLPEPPSVQLERCDRASRMSAMLVASRPHLSAVPIARLQCSTCVLVCQAKGGGASSHGSSRGYPPRT